MSDQCPIYSQVRETISAGRSFAKLLRRTRRKAHRCRTCTGQAECVVLEELNQVVDRVVFEITSEWGRSS
jgi:hypothetical protein